MRITLSIIHSWGHDPWKPYYVNSVWDRIWPGAAGKHYASEISEWESDPEEKISNCPHDSNTNTLTVVVYWHAIRPVYTCAVSRYVIQALLLQVGHVIVG